VPASEIDDLVQEVFLRMQVHGQAGSIDHLDRYLFTVAASVLADGCRRRAVRHGDDHESFTDLHHPSEDVTPERVILDREALDLVVRAIAEMSERTRDVFVLHRFEEMSCRAIAVQLGISESAVEKHVMKAMRFLHDRLRTA
jgi:RNA polymerase sigma-70 factor (ECF subfamily)